MQREQKLRRINNFRRAVPHVTASALGKIAKHIEEHGAAGLSNRNQLSEASSAIVDKEIRMVKY